MECIFLPSSGEYLDDRYSFIFEHMLPSFTIDWYRLLTECEMVGKYKKLWCIEIVTIHLLLGCSCLLLQICLDIVIKYMN